MDWELGSLARISKHCGDLSDSLALPAKAEYSIEHNAYEENSS